MSTQSNLSQADVLKLLSEPSAENRAEAARKVGTYFTETSPTGAERALAEDIFRALVKDAEVRVRKALSETLKENPSIPADVARTLASDVSEVALPVIEFSSVLTDKDLLDIIGTNDPERQVAVAKRATVSPDIADALAESGDEAVVSTLVGNDGAQIKDATFARVLDKYSGSDAVKTPLTKREKLPLAVAERLVTMVTESLRDHLVTHHELSPSMATDLLLESRERATVSLLTPGINAPDVLSLVDQLHKNGRLSPTLIIRALCMGDMTFFEAALAKRAGISVANAWQLVHDKGQLGLTKLFDRAEMPAALLHVARIGTAISEEMRLTSGDDRDLFRNVMIERVLTQIDQDLDSDNLDYLIGKLGRKAA
ncbi:hypothetical protein GCM10007972_19100 [Iodidimonas muriae]|uniref:DUF2336 domain-containing protein n=1 Tax=Iodidimonas muriae TaxID=261467 RepID=A0ABQ2LE14_9PROT|nr:DUF2336 domain-containing protein [Iodidimonas muriae]GGO13172.1 hypothetical protein GCM10007972_19100 [Iodidimonas muriae]